MKILTALPNVTSILVLPLSLLGAVTPAPQEFSELNAWTDAKFGGHAEVTETKPGLLVLEQHDPRPFQKNKNPLSGKPLKLGQQEYSHGLFCHAPSRVVVSLPMPGKAFSGIVGVDSNQETMGGHGSVIFQVFVDRNAVFKSEVLREGMAGQPVAIDLHGVTQFTLHVSDAGDGHILDQGAWFDAKVLLEDGTTLWLGDLPTIKGPRRHPYDTQPPFTFIYQGQSSSEWFAKWPVQRDSRKLDEHRTELTLTATDAVTGLR